MRLTKFSVALIVAAMLLIACTAKQDPFIANLQTGVEYKRYIDGSCGTSHPNKHCLSIEEYKKICEASKSVTKLSLELKATESGYAESALLKGGNIQNVKVTWGATASGKEYCFAIVSLSGLVDGTSKKIQAEGVAQSFIKNEKGEVLVSGFSSF